MKTLLALIRYIAAEHQLAEDQIAMERLTRVLDAIDFKPRHVDR